MWPYNSKEITGKDKRNEMLKQVTNDRVKTKGMRCRNKFGMTVLFCCLRQHLLSFLVFLSASYFGSA